MEGWRNASKFYKQIIDNEEVDPSLLKDAKKCLSLDDLYHVGECLLNKGIQCFHKKYAELATDLLNLGIELCKDIPMNTRNVPRFEVLLFDLYYAQAWISVRKSSLREAKRWCTLGINSASSSSLAQQKVRDPGKHLALLAQLNMELKEYKSAKRNYALALRLDPTNTRARNVWKNLERLDQKLVREWYGLEDESSDPYTSDEDEGKNVAPLCSTTVGAGDGRDYPEEDLCERFQNYDNAGNGDDMNKAVNKLKSYVASVCKFLRLID